MRWPDGVFAPSLPFQSRTKHIVFTNPSTGNATRYIQPDDIINYILPSTGDVGDAITWPTDYSAFLPNINVQPIEDDFSRYRTTAVRICGKYVGPTGSDGGLIYLKSGMIDPYLAADHDPSAFLPSSVNTLSGLDFTVPLREGFEIVLQPADPTSRRFRSTRYYDLDGVPSTDEIDAIQQLQIELGDQWPYLVVSVRGAAVATNVLEIEVVVDYEFQMNPGQLASRSLQSSPPDDPVFRAAVGNAYRTLVDKGQNVASRAAVTASGGIENFVNQALTTSGRLLGNMLTGSAMLMMSRYMRRPLTDVQGPSSARITRIQEL